MFTGFNCDKDHVKKTGRLCGSGGIQGATFKVTGVECMYLCQEKEICRSYAYSPTTRKCKLQRQSEPPNNCQLYNKNYKDYVWCSKKRSCNKGALIFVYKVRFLITELITFVFVLSNHWYLFSLQECVQQLTASHANSHSFIKAYGMKGAPMQGQRLASFGVPLKQIRGTGMSRTSLDGAQKNV